MKNTVRLPVECCICHRVHGDDGWVQKNTFESMGRVSHGYCPSCYKKVMSNLEIDFSLIRMRSEMLTHA